MTKPFAVILSGCGYLDGSEISEAVFTLLALSQKSIGYQVFAPNRDAFHTVNHTTGEPSGEKRNILEEVARITRGQVLDLEKLIESDYSAVLLPGGYGAAKNLSTFAFNGSSGEVDSTLTQVLKDFHRAKKPIGAICIAPAIVALALKGTDVLVTIGNDAGTATEIEKCGAKHKECSVTEIAIDQENRVVSTPAYMYDQAPLKDIFTGISSCIEQVATWA